MDPFRAGGPRSMETTMRNLTSGSSERPFTATGASVFARRDYMTLGTPSIGSWPAVEPERVRVLGFEHDPRYGEGLAPRALRRWRRALHACFVARRCDSLHVGSARTIPADDLALRDARDRPGVAGRDHGNEAAPGGSRTRRTMRTILRADSHTRRV